MENRTAKTFDTIMKQARASGCLLFDQSYITFYRVSFCKTCYHARTRTFIMSQKDKAGGIRKYSVWRFTKEYDGAYLISELNEYKTEAEAKKGQLKFDYDILIKEEEGKNE